jgi:flagellar basal-body rod protein FlgF
VPEDVEPTRAEGVTVQQGYLESSNVKMINELVSMIMVSRLYEANMKLVATKKEASSGLMSVAVG